MPVYKGMHEICLLRKSHLTDGLDESDRGSVLEHLCPYGLSETLSDGATTLLQSKCVRVVDRALSNLILGKTPN